MKFTENFNLNLPDLDDMADVEKMNENFQTIDTKMKSLETDPELAANVVDIKNKIGTESDADTQPTLFGRLAQLKNVLVEKLAEVLTKVTGIDGKIGTSGDTAGSATLFGQIKQNYSGLDVFDTLRMKKEVVTVNVPSGSGTYTAIFKFSEGKKKIMEIMYESSTNLTSDGTYSITVDGTEYPFSAPISREYDGSFLEFFEDSTKNRILHVKRTNSFSYDMAALKTVVEQSFEIKMLISKKSTQGKASVIIYYE